MTSQRRPRRAAATLKLTGALSRDTLVPERRLPVRVPSATTPLAVARKLVIFALIETVDDVAALADAGTANATAATSAASMTVRDLMPAHVPAKQAVQVLPSSVRPAAACLRGWIARGSPDRGAPGRPRRGR